ncbi:hypothetical protein GJ744_008210 [Endocarpon pusillum]|uniref:Fungal N-terminal domain-containing protein n=1 Tax=Endocarpon pusillum TaxID=364733 RepID=A0A8H7ALS1_9EURO|nr:hypothetical protein GJ744_008210 [Endocarpon pusillum]
MEAVGFVASIGTLIQGANYIKRTLDDYRRGGEDRERLLVEVNSLKCVLDRLKADSDKAEKGGKQEAWLDIVGHLSSKGGVLERIDDVISEIKLKIEPKQGLRGGILKWTWPFVKTDVDRNVRQMQHLSHSVSLALQDASLKSTLAINERVTRVDVTTNKRELRTILAWLSSLNFLEQQRLEFLKAFPGTCEWFLLSPEYSAWRQKQQRVLHCSAIGGAGKTILASMAIYDLRIQTAGQDVGIFILYCKHDRPDTHSAQKLAMTMLRQLIQIRAGLIPPNLEKLLEKHYYTNDTTPDFNEVLEVINAQLPTFSAVFIVLDGLDEIVQETAREEIITFLMKLEGDPRIMFTSRPIDVIEKIFIPLASDRDFDASGSVDTEESGYYSTEDEAEDEYDSDLSGESGNYGNEDEAEDQYGSESSDQDAEKGTAPQRYPLSFTPETSITQSDNPSSLHPDSVLACSNCGQDVASLQYHCQKCTGNRSIICVRCYDSGIRCVSGDSNHHGCVAMRIPCLKMDVSARPRAIRTYVRRRTQQSPVLLKFVKLKPGFAEEIEDVVTRAAQKMFLLAQLHMDAMSNPDLLKFSEVRNALDHLPTGLYDSYDKAMDRIQKHGKSLLRLVAYARRPLTTQEVEHALGVSSERDELLDDEIIPATTLISRCAGLVALDENNEVVFSHYTIFGYFDKRGDDLFGNGNKYMAETCLNYLDLKEFHQGPVLGQEEGARFDDRLKAYPFLDYASIFWAIHAKASKDDDILELAHKFIKNDERRNASTQALWFSSDETTANWRSRRGESPLHLAMYFRYNKLANRLLEAATDANILDSFGMTPLMWAAQAGDVEMTTKILQMQVPLNLMNSEGENALHLAISHRHEDVAVLLIDQRDVDVNAPAGGERRTRNVTPLMLAVERDEIKVVQKLLTRNDILVNRQDTRGVTALHRSALAEITEALVGHPSIDLEPRDELGIPPLITAAICGNLSTVRALLDAGADINIRQTHLDAKGNALMRAADYDHVAVVHELIRRGIDWNAKDTFDRSAVHSAAINGSARSLAALLDLPGVDVNIQDVNGNTPLHDAAGLDFDSEALEILLAKGARPDIRNGRGETPLDAARARGRKKNELILEKKYAEDLGMPERSMTGMSLKEPILTQAAQQGDEAAVESILAAYGDQSIDIEERDDWLGRTPLQHATDGGHLHIVEKLYHAGASINVQDKRGRTALHIAALRRHHAIARFLLRNGADMTLKDQWSVNVMEDAAPALQILLLQYGIEVTKDQDLDQLLFLAAERGNMKVVRRLIDAGAEVQIKDHNGRSPYERAKQKGKTEVAKYLDQIGKSVAKPSPHLPSSLNSSTSVNTLNAIVTPEPTMTVEASSARGGGLDGAKEGRLDEYAQVKQRRDDSQNAQMHHQITNTASACIDRDSPTSIKTNLAELQAIDLTSIRNYVITFLLALMLGLYLR